MTGSPSRLAALAGLAALAAAACDPVDGTDPYALWETHEHPGGAFHFHTLEPPWEAADDGTVSAPARALAPTGAAPDPIAGPGARARVEARAVAAATPAAAAEERRAYWAGAGWAVSAPEPFANRAGDLGVAQRAESGGLAAVDVIFAGDGGVVLLTLWGDGPLAGEDFRLLLEGFEPRAAGAH